MTSLEIVPDLADWPEARALWRLDPDVAHLNHGSFGAVPGPVADVQQELRDRMHANPVRFFKVERQPLIEAAREAAAAFVGADPAGFALVTNATTGASSVLAGFPLEPGDEVLVTDHGYGAVTYAVERACARSGARLVTVAVPLDADAATIEGLITAAVTPRTRLAVIDHITSPTARLFPVERIVPALRERGVAVFVDAAHAPGMLPVDLAALEPDFWTGNFHKWPCVPAGTGGLYVAPRWRAQIRPLVASWNEPLGFPQAFDDYGTADPTAWLAAPATFDLLGGLGLGPDAAAEHGVGRRRPGAPRRGARAGPGRPARRRGALDAVRRASGRGWRDHGGRRRTGCTSGSRPNSGSPWP